jgi:hypothetical protein
VCGSSRDDLDVAEAVIAACARRDADLLARLFSASVRWFDYGTLVAGGEGAPGEIVSRLLEPDCQLELVDVAVLVDGLVVGLFEGTERLPSGGVHAGSRFRSYEIEDGLLATSESFAYRKDVLHHRGLTVGQAQGALIVRSDDDQRLYHLNGPANARVEQVNTQIRLIIRRGFGYRSPEAVIALAMLTLGGLCPSLPRR